MKKIILSLIAAVACMSINAQVIKVYKNNGTTPEATYTNTETDKYKVVFEEAPAAPTTGTAKATINGSEVEIEWVQLWANGPKFARRNVGATGSSDKESTIGTTTMTYADAAKTGTDYVWGENWKTPSKDEMDLLNTSKVTCSYTTQDDVYGFKFTGVQEGYTSNSLFLPANSGNSSSGSAVYWSSTTDGTDNAFVLSLYYYNGDYSTSWDSNNQSSKYYVRPVLR